MLKDSKMLDKEAILSLVNLVQRVNHLLCEFYQQHQQNQELQVSSKMDSSPVTEADLAAHHLIEQGLNKLTPTIPVLSEESSSFEQRHHWKQFWLVDPLDGTREFINKTGEFTVNIALITAGQVELSLISIPTLKRTYLTYDDQPIYRIDDTAQGLSWQQITPQPVDLNHWKVAISRRSERPLYQQFKNILDESKQDFSCVNAGSAYKFCLMLESEVDVYPRFHPTSEWDTASGQGLLQAMGGGLFDLDGKPFCYNQRQSLLNGNFIAVRHLDFLPAALKAANQSVSLTPKTPDQNDY